MSGAGATDLVQSRFDALQRKLVPLWRSIQSFNQDEQTIVIVPSITLDFTATGAVLQAYEERFLFLLFLLRQPRARVVYVTSQAIAPEVVEYYLDLLPGVPASHARRRLFLVAPLDGSARPLSQKLLERPDVLAKIRSLVLDPDRAHLVPFNTTDLERDLSLALGIPMYGADPRFLAFGTKSGARRIFAEVGAPHPLGVENLTGVDDLVSAIARLRAEKPAIAQVMVKLNEGVSGEGNALVRLDAVPPAGDAGERAVIHDRLRAMTFELPGLTYDKYAATLRTRGGIVEERIAGTDFRSPSVQLRVTPLGKVELLSTHDQILGGPSGQSYLGCRFPADTEYGPLITREAAKVGTWLASQGVIGRFALDFVVVRNARGEWEAYAIEINLRKGGTTHPFLTLQFLTDGVYDHETGVFTTATGHEKCLVASDHEESPAYRALTPHHLFDIAVREGVHFDHARQTGVIFHMMSALGEAGRFGLTAIADTHAGADALHARTIAAIAAEAARLSGAADA
ncbi:MAG TPA: peptide ligase PGM1-related protein [Vicinamibacterales bacterium]|nr:peptide ligase PGM1-related protein [Vicinamibacterales bacterium]